MQTIGIENEIRKFIVDNYLFGREEALREDDPLLGNVVESTGVIELVLFLQDRFAITILDEEVNPDNFNSLKDLTLFIGNKLSNEA
jgi:acyl carrier protein